MSTQEATQAAAKYIQDQADIMRKYGESPKLSGENYDSAVRETSRTFQTISTRRS
jgi:hypothetical protein